MQRARLHSHVSERFADGYHQCKHLCKARVLHGCQLVLFIDVLLFIIHILQLNVIMLEQNNVLVVCHVLYPHINLVKETTELKHVAVRM
jgi:hypothetical protein